LALTGCGSSALTEGGSAALIGDATSITQNADGTFHVVCKNGMVETDTAAQIQNNQVCLSAVANPTDPFDPASCSGATLTTQQALAYVNLTKGIQDVKIGRFQVYRRWRQIYTGWPASDWQSNGISDITNTNPLYTYSYPYYTYYYFNADAPSPPGLAKVPMQGEIHIDYDNNKPLISLYGDAANFVVPATTATVDPTVAFSILDWDFTGSTISPPVYATSQPVNPYNSSQTSALGLTFAGHTSFTFQSAIATSSCVRFAFDGTENETDSDGNTWVKESQLVVYGTFGS
jgi:hypothetical protein